MALSQTFSRIYEAWHRRRDDDLEDWLEVWLQAFHLADFILDDVDLAQAVAHDAVRRIDEERPKRRHQLNNLAWYQGKSYKSGRQARLRKPLLRDHQYLDLLVFFFSREREDQKLERGSATKDDLDVWFIKSIFEHSYWLGDRQQGAPTLRLLLGVSAGILNYQVYEQVPLLWEKLVSAVPRRKELWLPGEEPFQLYWQKLLKSVRDRFGSLIRRDGPDDFVRRLWDEQSESLAWQAINRFELSESRDLCLGKVGKLGNDNLAETMRLHVITHRSCLTTLVTQAGLPEPKKKIRLPEYKVNIQGSPGNSQRGSSRLSEDQINEVRNRLRENLYQRKGVNPSAIVITLDDKEQVRASRELARRGRASVRVPENSRLCQIWARFANGDADVLLTACSVARPDTKPRVVLDCGAVISLSVKEPTDTNSADYELKVVYQQSLLARCFQAVLPNGRFINPIIGYPRLAAGFISLLLIILGLGLRPVAVDVITALRSNPEKQVPPVPYDQSFPQIVRLPPPSPPTQRLEEPPRQRVVSPNATRSQRRDGLPSLANIDRIYVEKPNLFASGADNLLVKSVQDNSLDQSGMISASKAEGAAQATLSLNTDYRSGGKRFVRPRLALKNGTVIWEGPVIEVGEEANSSQVAGLGEAEMRQLVEQLKNAVKELIRAKAAEQHRR